jgi:uncharacterized membrane protein (UPF0127 family)
LTGARIAVVIPIVLTLVACGSDDGDSGNATDPPGLTRITFVNENGRDVDLLVEVADTPEERSKGLMSRESLPDDQGMLFVFEQEGQASFYMRNTLIPLSVAFVEGEGAIIEIEDMQAQTEDLHSAPEPYLYAIEANQGWFARNGIDAGSEVRIARTAPTATSTDSASP